MPMLHRTLAVGSDLIVGAEQQRLFEGATRGDSSDGTQQGAPPSSAAFSASIQVELRALDEELRHFGGCARAIMDDIYAIGPASVVFDAVTRFAAAVQQMAGLVMQVGKLTCWSPEYELEHCLPFPSTDGCDTRQLELAALP